MPEWLLPILIAGGVGLGLSLLGKIMPKVKLEKIMGTWGDSSGKLLEVLLLRWFDRKTEQAVEEGVFCTLAYGIIAFCQRFIATVLSNNVEGKQ
jgi:hypothetical protein